MELRDARFAAQDMLELLVKNQPGLATEKTGNHINDGASLADFCHDFMEQYAKRLMDRKDQSE